MGTMSKLGVERGMDGRYRSDAYSDADGERFCVAEKTAKGVLVTEFMSSGEVRNQIYYREGGAEERMRSYLKDYGELEMRDVKTCEAVVVQAECPSCGSSTLARELDLVEPRNIVHVPVVPMFVCSKCYKKFYSISDSYIRRLVEGNKDLFTDEELAMKAKDEGEFVHTLQEYVIRMFAAKRIQRMKIKQ